MMDVIASSKAAYAMGAAGIAAMWAFLKYRSKYVDDKLDQMATKELVESKMETLKQAQLDHDKRLDRIERKIDYVVECSFQRKQDGPTK